MLQKFDVETFVPEEDRSYLLEPSFYWDLAKRRFFYFVIPFVLILSGGIGVALLWPATYLSEGKILVETQQIPTDLVRPTVTSLADERIQVIQQRILTRDNLVAIMAKFNLFPGRRNFLSDTEQTELMRKAIQIEPLTIAPNRARPNVTTIAFTVGFFYENPTGAAQVANELMTRILNEDLRDRTTRASDTTKFLMREVQRLRDENAAIDTRIADYKKTHPAAVAANQNQALSPLLQLKAEYLQKSQIYSAKHPALITLKRQIDAMEKGLGSELNASPTQSQDATSSPGPNLDALEAQQESLQKDLEATMDKLAVARLGEKLEQDQQSEKFEIIEQPSEPQKPYKPNRPKLAGISAALALMAGVGFVFLAEMADKSIRRVSDLYSIADRGLVLSIPFIATNAEIRRHRRNLVLVLIGFACLFIGIAVAAFFILPAPDLWLPKIRVMLSR